MSAAAPKSTPVPVAHVSETPEEQTESICGHITSNSNGELEDSSAKGPVFRLHLNDLSHISSSQFLNLVDGSRLLPNALSAIRKHLYPRIPTDTKAKPTPNFQIPPTRSVTLILRPSGGVAYTTGLDIDSSHKEIHFNLDYIRDCTQESPRRRQEIIGVVTHEMVHCYQYDGQGTAPGGLIEGIADFVRLKAELGPPHWFGKEGKRERGEKWDAGYQRTAFFLDWLEEEYGLGTVGRINDALKTNKYDEEKGEFWERIFGKGKNIAVLWDDYCTTGKDEAPKKRIKKKSENNEQKMDEEPSASENGHEDDRPTKTQPPTTLRSRDSEIFRPLSTRTSLSDDLVVVETE